MSEPAKNVKKCYFSETIKLFIALEGLFLLFQFKGKSKFSRFLSKKFYNIDHSS